MDGDMHTVDPKRLRAARVKANLNQAEVAEKIGVTKKSVSHYETGRAKPSADGLLNFLIAFDLGAADIAKKI